MKSEGKVRKAEFLVDMGPLKALGLYKKALLLQF